MPETDTAESQVASHYSKGGLKRQIRNALEEEGLDGDSLSIDDLAPVDEFHFRGKEATRELVQKIGLEPNDSVLDVGCGIGGTARYIAQECECTVTGIDLTPEFIEVAEWMTEMVGMDNPPAFTEGNATSLPFENNSFDVVITEHVNMNIADKQAFLDELHRVVRPGGRVCFYEILAGPAQPAVFPVPWSETEETSFLVPEDEIRDVFDRTGFEILSWEDTTEKARDWYRNLVRSRDEEGPPAVGIHLLLGDRAPEMFQNLGTNLREERIKIIQAVLQKG